MTACGDPHGCRPSRHFTIPLSVSGTRVRPGVRKEVITFLRPFHSPNPILTEPLQFWLELYYDVNHYSHQHRASITLPIVVLGVEQTRGQRQTGRNDLPGKGESVAKWMVIVENKKC